MCIAAQPAGSTSNSNAAAGGAVAGVTSGASLGAMFGPVGAAVGAVGGGAAGIMGGIAANKNAKQVEEARRIEAENMIMETRRRATQDFLDQTRMEREQQAQEEAAVAIKGGDIARETNRSVATATASAAERGVAGRTVDEINRDYEVMANEEVGRIKANQRAANRQHDEMVRGYGTQFENRVADVRPYVKKAVAPVDYFGPAFSTLGQLGTLEMNLENQRQIAAGNKK